MIRVNIQSTCTRVDARDSFVVSPFIEIGSVYCHRQMRAFDSDEHYWIYGGTCECSMFHQKICHIYGRKSKPSAMHAHTLAKIKHNSSMNRFYHDFCAQAHEVNDTEFLRISKIRHFDCWKMQLCKWNIQSGFLGHAINIAEARLWHAYARIDHSEKQAECLDPIIYSTVHC